MKKIKTHIVLLSDQVLPNVLPALDAAISPANIVLCESDAMCHKGIGQRLKDLFESKSIECETFALGGAYDFNALEERFLELAARYDGCEADVAVNLTGGTKLMAIAAQNVFGAGCFTCFYSIPQRNEIVEITGERSPPVALRHQIKLNDYFLVHGYKVLSKQGRDYKLVHRAEQLAKELLSDLGTYSKHIGYLNMLAAKAEEAYSLKVRTETVAEQEHILELFYRYGFIKYFDDKKVEFGTEENRSFCKGLWLESHLHQTFKDINQDIKESLGEGLQDYATSVVVKSSTGTKNEFDGAFIYKNNLYVVEAKTAQLKEKGADVLYKLDSLKDFAGMYTRPIIVTFRSLKGYDKKRATDLGINVIEGSALNALGRKLKEIMGILDNSKGDQQ